MDRWKEALGESLKLGVGGDRLREFLFSRDVDALITLLSNSRESFGETVKWLEALRKQIGTEELQERAETALKEVRGEQ